MAHIHISVQFKSIGQNFFYLKSIWSKFEGVKHFPHHQNDT